MPRVRFRRQSSTQKEVEQWGAYFELGYADFYGIECPARSGQFPYWGQGVPLDVARAKWNQLGAAYMATRPDHERAEREEPWALRQFGSPGGNVVEMRPGRRKRRAKPFRLGTCGVGKPLPDKEEEAGHG